MSDWDWADKRAEQMATDWGLYDGGEYSVFDIANALRAAHKQGKIEGLREAKDTLDVQVGRAQFLIRRLNLEYDKGALTHLTAVSDWASKRLAELEAE